MLKKMISLVYHRKQIITIVIFLFSLTLFLTWVNPVLAFELSPPPQEAGLPALIVWLIQLALIISGFVMVGILIVGGFQYFFSAGQPEKMITARNKIFSSLMGLALLLTAFSILYLINPELVDRERPLLKPIEPIADFEFFIVPETLPAPSWRGAIKEPEIIVSDNTIYALKITSLATGKVFRVSYHSGRELTPLTRAPLTRLRVFEELAKEINALRAEVKIDGSTYIISPFKAKPIRTRDNLDIVLTIKATKPGPEGGFSLANDGKGILTTKTITRAAEGVSQVDVVVFPLVRNKIVYVEPAYVEPETSFLFHFYLGWITEEYLYRNLLNPPVRCEWLVDIPLVVDFPKIGPGRIGISKGGKRGIPWLDPPGPHLLEPLEFGRQEVSIAIADPLFIGKPIKFHLRCYNKEGMSTTKTVSIEVRVKTVYYRVPTGKIIEWAVFDRNARTRFAEIESFIPKAIEQSNYLISKNRDLIGIIIAGGYCGMTTVCLPPCCVPSPQLELKTWENQGRVDECGDGTFEGELYDVDLYIPACWGIRRADPGEVLDQSLKIEEVLLSPDEPCNTFKALEKRRRDFFGLPLPIDLNPPKGPKSIIFPPTPNVQNHSGAFNHWRVKRDDTSPKWTRFLVYKRKIESGRNELRRYLNSLQLTAFLMSAGCKNHPEFPLTHHQLLPEMVRDPFRYRDTNQVRKGGEVIDIIEKMEEIRIDDLINWEIKDSYHVYIYRYKDNVQFRLKKIEDIETIKQERRMAVQRIKMENPPKGEIFTIFEYDPFTFYCPAFYHLPKITDLKGDANRITNIRFGPKSSANPTLNSITNPDLDSIFKPILDFSSDFICSNLMNSNNQNGFVVLENERIAENQIAILTSGVVGRPNDAVGRPKAKQLLHLGDVRMHEIPSGQAVEEAIDLLTQIDKNLTIIIEAMLEQERIALKIMRLAYDDFNPIRCRPTCKAIYDADGNKVGCEPLPCEGHPYDLLRFARLAARMEHEKGRILKAQEGIRGLLHHKEKWETIWFFPREVTRIERIEALTEQTRALLSVCPVRPRGKLYHEYGGKPTGRPKSCVEIRRKILAGEIIEGVYAVTAAIIGGIPGGGDCFAECRPPNRESQNCLDCLRDIDIICRAACLNNPLGEQCLACIPCRSLKNYFCFFLEERFYPK